MSPTAIMLTEQQKQYLEDILPSAITENHWNTIIFIRNILAQGFYYEFNAERLNNLHKILAHPKYNKNRVR